MTDENKNQNAMGMNRAFDRQASGGQSSARRADEMGLGRFVGEEHDGGWETRKDAAEESRRTAGCQSHAP